MTEKRVFIASFVSIVFLVIYTQTLRLTTRSTPPAKNVQAVSISTTATSAEQARENEAWYKYKAEPIEKEDVVLINSDDLQLEIGRKSGAVRKVVLKKFAVAGGASPLEFSWSFPIFSVHGLGGPISWVVINESESRVEFSGTDRQEDNYRLTYSLPDNSHVLRVELNSKWLYANKGPGISTVHSWVKSDDLGTRYNPIELFLLNRNNAGKHYRRYAAPWRSERELEADVPRGTKLLSLTERYFCQSIRIEQGQLNGITLVKSPDFGESIKLVFGSDLLSSSNSTADYSASIYFGPRDYFYLKKSGFAEAIPIGAFGQIGLMLLVMLNAIAGVTRNYGVAVIIFSVLITLITAPFTLLGFHSMKKLQQLRPDQEKIMAQYKNDPSRANQEIVALYKKHKVSPLGGCLPMLLQMPVFFAMFRAISHFIELRGKPFLWIKDLSLPDKAAQLPFFVPFLGRDLNALPIIMAVAMYFQTKMSQSSVTTDPSNPANVMSGPIMPILFGAMFYHFPSGLVLYWLTNTLMALALYRFSGLSKTPETAK